MPKIAPNIARDTKTAPQKPTALKHRNLPMLMLQARELVLARFRPILKKNGLSEQQWRILRVLLERGPLEPREIVRACVISSPSLAGILARMDSLGLVQREGIQGDLRRVKVSLTAKSRMLAARIAPEVEAVYQAIESQAGRGSTEQLYRRLDVLVAALGEPR